MTLQQIFLGGEAVYPTHPESIPSVLYLERAGADLSCFQEDFLKTLNAPLKGVYDWAEGIARLVLKKAWSLILAHNPLGQAVLIACHEGVILFVRHFDQSEEGIDETKRYMMRFGATPPDVIDLVPISDRWPVSLPKKLILPEVKKLELQYYRYHLLKKGRIAVMTVSILVTAWQGAELVKTHLAIQTLQESIPVVSDAILPQEEKLAQLIVLSENLFPLKSVLEKIRSILPPEIVVLNMAWQERELVLELALANPEVLPVWIEQLRATLPTYQIAAAKTTVTIKR